MLDKITDYLVGKVGESGYFDKVFPLVEMIERDGMRYPAQYIGVGQYKSVNDFDHYDGMCYFRMNGKQTVFNPGQGNGVDKHSMATCEETLQFTFPLRLVACVPKYKLTKDDAFTDERVSRSLISLLTTFGGLLKGDLNASELRIQADSVTFDNRQVLSEEYQNVQKMKDVNYNYSYHAIDFRVVVEVSESCLTTECEEYYG